MASILDAHPDLLPEDDVPGSVEQDTPGGEPQRENVEDDARGFVGASSEITRRNRASNADALSTRLR